MINRIIIPTQDSTGQVLADNNLNLYLKVISETFGGCTVIKGLGTWVNESNGLLITEETHIVEVDTKESASEFFIRLAERIKAELKQDSVYYREGESFPHFI